MDDRIERGAFGLVGEDHAGELGAVEGAVGAEDVGAELADYRVQSGRARLDNLTGDRVGVDDHGTVLPQQPGDGALSRADTPGESDPHPSTVSVRVIRTDLPPADRAAADHVFPSNRRGTRPTATPTREKAITGRRRRHTEGPGTST